MKEWTEVDSEVISEMLYLQRLTLFSTYTKNDPEKRYREAITEYGIADCVLSLVRIESYTTGNVTKTIFKIRTGAK